MTLKERLMYTSIIMGLFLIPTLFWYEDVLYLYVLLATHNLYLAYLVFSNRKKASFYKIASILLKWVENSIPTLFVLSILNILFSFLQSDIFLFIFGASMVVFTYSLYSEVKKNEAFYEAIPDEDKNL